MRLIKTIRFLTNPDYTKTKLNIGFNEYTAKHIYQDDNGHTKTITQAESGYQLPIGTFDYLESDKKSKEEK